MSLVLATGGLGFIGSHTCINLVNKGYDVLIVDSLLNRHDEIFTKILNIIDLKKNSNRGNIFFEKGDLLDKLFLEKIFKENTIDTVVHFAGLKSVEESVKNPINYWNTNINIALNILTTMENYKCYKFIQELNNWDVSNVTNMRAMFSYCDKLINNKPTWYKH